jgi:hypothetical protein
MAHAETLAHRTGERKYDVTGQIDPRAPPGVASFRRAGGHARRAT